MLWTADVLLIVGLLGKTSAQGNTIDVVLPPNTPPGAYDSLAYVQLLRNEVPCPGVQQKGMFAFVHSRLAWANVGGGTQAVRTQERPIPGQFNGAARQGKKSTLLYFVSRKHSLTL